jgi:hypothetical protein
MTRRNIAATLARRVEHDAHQCDEQQSRHEYRKGPISAGARFHRHEKNGAFA